MFLNAARARTCSSWPRRWTGEHPVTSGAELPFLFVHARHNVLLVGNELGTQFENVRRAGRLVFRRMLGGGRERGGDHQGDRQCAKFLHETPYVRGNARHYRLFAMCGKSTAGELWRRRRGPSVPGRNPAGRVGDPSVGPLERADAFHLVVAEREVEHIEIGGDAFRI